MPWPPFLSFVAALAPTPTPTAPDAQVRETPLYAIVNARVLVASTQLEEARKVRRAAPVRRSHAQAPVPLSSRRRLLPTCANEARSIA